MTTPKTTTARTAPASTAAMKAEKTGKRPGRPARDPKAPFGLGADGKPLAPHGHLPNGNPRQYAPRGESNLSVDFLATPSEVSDADLVKAAPKAPRTEHQKAMDAVVDVLKKRWEGEGKPSAWDKLPKAKYEIAPEHVKEFTFLVNKAAAYHGVGVRYGRKDLVNEKNGKSIVIFAVRARARKPRSSDGE
jgi:hypothetical protein